jgi:copper transport protein
VPSVVLAHARLLKSSPRAGERLTTSPARIVLEFSEVLARGMSRVALVGPRGATIRLAQAASDSMGSHTIVTNLTQRLSAGTYTIHWLAAGRDGHPQHGSFSFTVLGPISDTTVAGSEDTALTGDTAGRRGTMLRGDTAVSRDTAVSEGAADTFALGQPMTAARWVGFLALFSVIGALAFRFAVLPRVARLSEAGDPFEQIASVGAATYGLFAAIALVVTTVIKLYGQSVAMREIPPEAILFATGWGWAWSAQMVACLVAVVGFAIAHRGTRSGWRLAALAGAVLVVTPAATGHAIGGDEALFAVPIDVLHVLAGSVWVGTLGVILIAGIGAAAKTPGTVSLGTRVAAMINAFSPLALVCGAAIVATGVVASLLRLEPFSSLWTSTYGKVLIVKLALVSLLFVVGAWNWRRVKPTLGGNEGVKALRLSARAELSVSALVLVVTAVLVALPLPE